MAARMEGKAWSNVHPLPRLLLLLAAVPAAEGWAVYADRRVEADFQNASSAMAGAIRWTYKRPLIRWAMTPDFCATMQPLLVENQGLPTLFGRPWQNFTTCDRMRGIIRDAFQVWSEASPALHFVEVTDRCDAERMWRPLAEEECAESAFCLEAENATGVDYIDWKLDLTPLEDDPSTEAWKCSSRTCWQCDRADVMIGGFTQKNRRLGDQHAKARVQRIDLSEQPPLSPTGVAAAGKTVLRGWVEFNVDDEYKNTEGDNNGLGNVTVPNTWRLDNDICDAIIALPGFDTGSALGQAITIIFWCVFSVGICACCFVVYGLLMRLAGNLLTGWDVDRDGKLELSEIGYVLDEFCGEVCFECRCPTVHHKKLTALSGVLSVLETVTQTSIIRPLFLVIGILGLFLVYRDGVNVCFESRDFRASAIHEIGHLLSLEHSSGADDTIPLVRGAAPPPPPPPLNATTGEELPIPFNMTAEEWLGVPPNLNTTGPYLDMYDPVQCKDPYYGVEVDPAVASLLSPPPTPPPPPWPPYLPNFTYASPSPPPPLKPLETADQPLNYSQVLPYLLAGRGDSFFYRAPSNETPPGPSSFVGQMGSTIDVLDSVMLEFGSIGRERPIAGAPRRCINGDDLDGVNFLYPMCGEGVELTVAPCMEEVDTTLTGLRLLEGWVRLIIVPITAIILAKVFSYLFLVLEDQLASWQVRRLAKKLLAEAEVAERDRRESARQSASAPSGTSRAFGMVKGLSTAVRAMKPSSRGNVIGPTLTTCTSSSQGSASAT